MKRLVLFVLSLALGAPASGVVYDGPGTPLVYNQFINNITVLMTVQPLVLNGGIARFTMVAQVPIEADTIGKNVTLQIRRYAPETVAGFIVLDTCTRTPAPGSVGSTVSFSCDAEQFLSVGTGLTPGGLLGVYPYVQRPADLPVSVLTHDGVAQRVNVPVVGEDADEPNDTLVNATDLGTPSSPVVRTNRVSFLPDYYRVMVPPGAGSMEIRIDFWNAAADIDLFLLDGGGGDVAASPFSEDFEQINWDVNPGEVYYIKVAQDSTQPAFYNLSLTFTIPDVVTLTSGPTANPQVVSAGGTTTLSATAVDSIGHALNYNWTQTCPTSIGNGTFGDRSLPTTTWTAPANTSGSPKQCTLRVTVDDSRNNSATATVLVTVGLSGDVITFTTPPTGTPNPVTAPSLVSLNTAATDSFGHPLSYAWTANCPAFANNGTFAPNANQRTPAWAAPANLTGSTQTCTLTVTVADGFGVSASAGFPQQVAPSPHGLTLISGPAGTPNPVASGGVAALAVNAADSFGHGLSYTWSAACGSGLANGSFSNASTPTPTWTAPANLTGVFATCTIQVIVEDGFGLSQTGSYIQSVSAAVNTITISSGPGGAPNPAASGGAVAVTVAASDTLGRVLSYAWSASCTGGIGSGSFANGTTATPTWTAPANLTGVARTCTIGVTVSDPFGASTSGSYQQTVNPAPNPITITAGPGGTPNPVASGAAAAVSVTATDVLGRLLVYAWSSTCGGVLGSGTFASASTASPTWTAPANTTGVAQTCTIGVTIDDGFANTQSGSYVQTVNPAPNPITITAGPGGAPNPAASGGVVAMSVTAGDVLGRTLSYSWSALCGGGLTNGTFANGTTAAPSWTAPANLTGSAQICTVTVTIGDGFGSTKSGSFQQTVNAAINTVTITAGPTGNPNPVASGGAVAATVTAGDTLGRVLAYAWSATCTGGLGNGSFAGGTTAAPTWTAPANVTGVARTCTIGVTVSDPFGANTTGSYQQTVSAAPNPITITAGPNGAPNPVASSGQVAMTVTASDVLGRTLTYGWSASCAGGLGSGTFTGGTTATPGWAAPANTTGVARACTISVSIGDGFGNTQTGSYQQTVNPAPNPITISAGPGGTPNPVASGGTVAMSVTATDVLGRPLTYAWSATCVALASGTFTNGTTANPGWFAPGNVTGAPRTCTIEVTVSDGFGNTTTGAYQHVVNAAPNAITISAGPLGAPNPSPSGGTVAMSVTAADVLGRTLNYAWGTSCAGGIGNGTLTNAATAAPTWNGPVNLTGIQQACTVSVTVDDGLGITQTRSYQQVVDPAPNAITITAAPVGTPNPVASGGSVALTVAAIDQLGRTLSYAWSATCTGGLGQGIFSNPAIVTPSWTAPTNTSGLDRSCTIGVTVTDGFNGLASASYEQQVLAAPCTYTLTPTATSQDTDGGTGSVGVAAGTTCAWLASSSAPWLTITAGATGTGTGVVTFTVAPNPTPVAREAILTVAGQQVPVTQAGAGYTYYFAEGATINGFFETRFALLNRDPGTAATVTLDFQLKDTATVLTHALVVPPSSRRTVDVSTLAASNAALAALASAEFSTVVRSDRPLVADRTMTWDGQGYGSHAETAILAPASIWYLAEGATIGNFELYYLIQNPNPTALTFTVTYLLPPPAAPIVRSYPIGANTRTNIPVHLEPGLADVEVSAVIEAPSATPIIVERAMYLSTGGLFYGAGHESAGITTPATQWFFAEGATGDFFDLFILIGNPGTTAAQVTATFLFDDGTTCATTATVDPKSRFNFWVDTVVIPGCPRDLANASVSTTVTADVPVIAERAMWWPGPTAANWAEAHNAAGATTTGVTWGLADGEQGGPRAVETYILIANTSAYAGTARVTLYLEDGTTRVKDVALPANSRTNVAVGAPEADGGFGAALAGQRFGAVVDSLPVVGQAGAAQIVVERAMYSNGPGAPFWAAGTDVLATRIQ